MPDQDQGVRSIEVGGVTYDLAEVPAAESRIVQEKRSDILVGVKLDKLVADLNITSELIHLAYNATPEKYGDIRGQINQLHVGFADLCGECSSELGYVREAAREVSRKVADAYSKLYKQQEVAAVAILSTCQSQAEELAGRMGSLALKFKTLSDIADKALSDSEQARGDEIEHREQITRERNTLEADQENLKVLQEKLSELVEQLNTEYSEAKDDLANTEERAFTLSLVGAIMGPIGDGLGAAGSALAGYYATQDPSRIAGSVASGLNSPKNGGGTSEPEGSETVSRATPGDLKKVDTAKEDLDEAELDLKAAEADVETLDAMIEASSALKSKVDASDASADEKRDANAALEAFATDARSQQDEAAQAKAEAEQLRDDHKRKWLAAKEVVESLGVTVSEVGSNLQAMGSDYFDLAGQQRERVREIFKVMLEKQDAERDALGKLKEITIRLKGLDAQRQTADITISALFQTIGALKQVVAILHEATLFWNNMKKACEALAKSGIIKDIQGYTNNEAFAEFNRVDLFYSNKGFKQSLLDNAAKWVALGDIAREYIEETTKIREEARENFKANLTGAEAAVVVSDMSIRLLGDIANQLEDSEVDSDIVRKALANIKAAEAA